jgi:hypothetical protein
MSLATRRPDPTGGGQAFSPDAKDIAPVTRSAPQRAGEHR